MSELSSELALRLSKAQELFERGKQKRALQQLWFAEAHARGNAEAVREVLDVATAFGERVEPRRKSDLAELVQVLHHDIDTATRQAVGSPTRTSGSSPYIRRHKQRFSVAWWLKLVALAPLGITALVGLYAAVFTAHNGNIYAGYVVAGVAAALCYLGWRKPGLVGGLLLIAAPVGAFLGWLGWALGTGGSNRDLVLIELVFAGVPLVSGLLLMVCRAGAHAGQNT